MKQILSITRKELDSYFGSPMALIFLGTFLAVTLFTFFWVDTFFARGIANARPLFRWMPLLLIFLVAALTMRQWSEEQRTGTLEVLLTLPVRPLQLVVGKFLAVLALVGLGLLLTLPLPITASLLGNLDWGPVVGGYLAALLLASAYTAIGLFVSSRTDNQIVALITTGILGGLFYMVGTRGVTDYLGGATADLLRALGTGSRFESIERGVVDLRDLVYYLTLAGLFLALNTLSLESKRWSAGARAAGQRRTTMLTTALVGINLLLLNVWLLPLHGLRADLTQQQEYSLSRTTVDLLQNLQEPLLIRAYISERTHPLLEPLRPRIGDLLREYEIASGGKISANLLDPVQDPELEAEANQTYGIRPTPFQVSGRYEASVINSYFDILVRYGDQTAILNFTDLIEVEPRRDGTVDVRLRNLEYDLTSTIKKVVYGFQSVEAVLAALPEPVRLTLYVTPHTLPADLAAVPETIQQVAAEIARQSGGKFLFQSVDPSDPNAGVSRQALADSYGLQPFPVSFLSSETFYLHMVLAQGDGGAGSAQILYPSGDLSEGEIRTAIESALKRTSSGFLKVVGLWTPPSTPTQNVFGQMQQPISSWNLLREQLSQEYSVRPLDLNDGRVPADVDLLMVVAPQEMTDLQRFAIDQFLMRGGAVVVAASQHKVDLDPFTGGLQLTPINGGLQDLLAHYGVTLQNGLVMDPQNQPFPVPVTRQVGNMQIQEIQAINFPFFVDVRGDGMARDNGAVSNLPAVTLNWVSPVLLDETRTADMESSVLLRSTAGSWLRTNPDIQPNLELYPNVGFAVEGETKSYPLAISLQGAFESFFADKPSPFQVDPEADEAPDSAVQSLASVPGTIERSPQSARLLVIGSAQFVDDFVLNLSARLMQELYLNNLQFAQNAVDWAAEDLDLLTIRARGTSVRILKPMTAQEQTSWEVANYLIALLALLAVASLWQIGRRSEQPMELVPLSELQDE